MHGTGTKSIKTIAKAFSLSFDLGRLACINPAAALCSNAEVGPGPGLNGSRRRRPPEVGAVEAGSCSWPQ